MNRTSPHPMRPLAHALLGAVSLLLPAAPTATAQECERGRISYVFIDNHSVFDTDEIREGNRFRWAYELANSVHMTTTRDFIRDELVFDEGECYDPLLLEESERWLRRYDFIAQADVFGLRQPDGTWHVVVDTKDEWTTKVNVNLVVDEGVQFRGASITEENLLGEGYEIGIFRREREEEEDLGARFFTPRIFGTRTDVRFEIADTRSGELLRQEVRYPFVGEVGRLAFQQLFLQRDELFPYSSGEGAGFSHLLLPVAERRFHVTFAGRLGRPGNLTIFGLGYSHENLEYSGFPDELEVILDSDFDETREPPAGIEATVRPQTTHSGSDRVNLLFGQRNVTFVQRRGLDALRGVQDVPVGLDVALTVGHTVPGLSSTGDRPDHLYSRLRIAAGAAPEDLTVNAALSLEGRQNRSGSAAGDGWRDVFGEADALLYWQPSSLEHHTFFLRGAAAGGWHVDVPYQLTLGGATGVRGYRNEDYPGGRRLLLNVEDRVYVPWPFPELVDLGLSFFADAGRVWAGDVPFGADSGWRWSAGGGLRIGFPAGTRSVVRLDFAVPLDAGGGLDAAIFRVSVSDLLGLVGGVKDPQLGRSRRTEIGPDLFSRAR